MGNNIAKSDWPEGMRLAMVVGVGEYSEASGKGRLIDVPLDVREISLALADPGGFDVSRLNDPVGDSLRTESLERIHNAPSGCSLVLYFAGHGILGDEGGDVLLLGKDGAGVSGKDLASAMDDSEARNILLILDCCHGGAAALSPARFMPPRLDKDRTIHVIAASRADQPAKGGLKGGLLTRAIVDSIKSAKSNSKGYITLEEVESEVRDWFRGKGGQSPSFGGSINTYFPLFWREPELSVDDCLPDWFEEGALPPRWRIVWGEEKEHRESQDAVWLHQDAVGKKYADSTSMAFRSKKGMGAWGIDLADVSEIQLRKSPVLDEIWTLWMMCWSKAGQALPSQWEEMCEYCADVRGGITTDKAVPPEHRVRMIFQTIKDSLALSNPEAFLTEAMKLCRHLGTKLLEGMSVRSDDMMAGAVGFVRYLEQSEWDQARYLEDKQGARHFTATLNNGKERPLLVLDRPEASAYSHWSREDPDTPNGVGYRLLLVRQKGDDGKIVLSSDPAWRDSLSFLANGLSDLENQKREAEGFDWEIKYSGTMIVPPSVEGDWGTILSLDEIIDHLTEALSLKVL